MAFDGKSLDEYVDVATRVAEFRAAHPGGSLQPVNPAEPWRMVQVQGFEKNGDTAQQTFIVYTAAAYRTPDDQRPGIGCAWELFPGRTSFTRGSELMNAETSAWGRAIVAALAADTRKGIATRQDVERGEEPPARRAERGPLPPEQDHWTGQPAGQLPNGTNPEERTGSIDSRQRSQIFAQFKRLGIGDAGEQRQMLSRITGRDVPSRKGLSYVDAEKVVKALKAREPEPQPEEATS